MRTTDDQFHISGNSAVAARTDFVPEVAPVPLRRHYTGKINRKWKVTLALGVLSASLYMLMFKFSPALIHLSEMTRQGDKLGAIIPIAIAFVFSYVHGSFTAQFWSSLGLKPREQLAPQQVESGGNP